MSLSELAIIATIRTQDDLIEAMRTAKEVRNLSFPTIDELGGFTRGHVERVIGPRREKGMSPFMMQMLLSIMAMKLVLVPDPEQEEKVREHWEGRNTSNVRLEKGRVSKALLDRCRPLIMEEIIQGLTAAAAAARESLKPVKSRAPARRLSPPRLVHEQPVVPAREIAGHAHLRVIQEKRGHSFG
ncbi:hypothetical protein I3J27_18375 [Bradyrhizobium xenonodulans]|uniref:Transposase n=1 Tax=Bradyrhizobium xenonodulans TaxID=2736875 RepID=A0ABY7MXK1_9BRAD|nr:hypothetical protein [Bradyrhizobium xenonodulans]WBL82299.1 hypothetical protein I3J27_18375 [Bradyrhizobium xenonodulans]